MVPGAASHVFEDHTSETVLFVEADSLRALYAEAGRALADLFGSSETTPTSTLTSEIEISSSDRDALLIDFLNELIFRSENDGAIFDRIDIGHLTDTELRARLFHRASDLRTPVKAATWHGVHITEDAGRFRVRVILDV